VLLGRYAGLADYIDEGQGTPQVFVHGNPSWSFEYRGPILALRDRYRCIALDHLGFGLSQRGADPGGDHPRVHARNFAALLDHLALDGMVLIFSDWGGPIALSAARLMPDRVCGLVVLNSWCWPVNRIPRLWLFSALMSSALGQYLVRRHNLFVRGLMPLGVGRRGVLTRDILAHYVQAQADAGARAASAALPGQITGARDWLAEIWNQRDAFATKPALLLWGRKDLAFRRDQLRVWQAAFAKSTTRELHGCGHFVAEEVPEIVTAELDQFIQRDLL
jgi:haloalkane dehalogenase